MKNEGHASIYARWFILPTLIGVYFAFPNLPSLTFHQSGALGFLLKKKTNCSGIQDTIHIAVKLKSRFMTHSIVLSMGVTLLVFTTFDVYRPHLPFDIHITDKSVITLLNRISRLPVHFYY